METDHLALAREDLAIAEAGDSRREAYVRAAEHVAAHQAKTGESNAAIARLLQEGRKAEYVRRLLDWRGRGYPGDSPHARPGKDEGAARAHAKRVLRESPELVADEIADAVERLPVEQRDTVRDSVYRAEARDAAADPDHQRARRRLADRDHLADARKQLAKAVEVLSARLTFYADVPLDEHERAMIPLVRRCLEVLEAGEQVDAELEQLLDEATS